MRKVWTMKIYLKHKIKINKKSKKEWEVFQWRDFIEKNKTKKNKLIQQKDLDKEKI